MDFGQRTIDDFWLVRKNNNKLKQSRFADIMPYTKYIVSFPFRMMYYQYVLFMEEKFGPNKSATFSYNEFSTTLKLVKWYSFYRGSYIEGTCRNMYEKHIEFVHHRI